MMTQSNKPLSEVLSALAMAMPAPDPRTLEKFVRRYPEYADALTEFAVELALDPGGETEGDEDLPASDVVSQAVGRAISHFHDFAFKLERQVGSSTAAMVDPFATMTRDQFRAFAADLGVNTTFAMKLRDRSIDPETIVTRKGFCRAAANAAHVPIEAMIAHLQGPSSVSLSAHYKSEGKPVAAPRESFEEVLQRSNLSEEQQRKLLAL
jgi:hypothetical protein